MIKKLLIDILHTIIAALVGLAGFTVFSIFIAAVVYDAEDPMTQNMILAIVCTIAFIIGLIYVRKIRNEIGENEVSKDYKNEGYRSIKDDFFKVLKSEKWVLIAICVISLICYGANVYCYGVLGNEISPGFSLAFIAMTGFQLFFNYSTSGPILHLLGFLISIVVDIAAYIGVLLVYRKRLYDKNFTMTD